MRYTRKKTYYKQVTHEFNLPAGWSCPHADVCKTKVDRDSGKRVMSGSGYLCYAAVSERYPSVRDSRWANYDDVRAILKTDDLFDVPARATHVRVHGSGDFFNQAYFDRWMLTAAAHPDVQFWAFTKSVKYWVNRLGSIPANFELQASRGSTQDHLIDEHGLKCAEVFSRLEDVPGWMVIDMDDSAAQSSGPSFALLDNFKHRDQGSDPLVLEHNRVARLSGFAD